MLVAVGVVAQVVQGVVIFKQSNTISKLDAENKNWSEKFDAKVKEIEDAKDAQIAALETKNQELIKSNQELAIASQELAMESREMNAKLNVILGMPGIQTVLQNWQEAGDMYRSNLSEPSTVKSFHRESCSETASIADSDSDIEIIDHMDPSTSMNGLTLSRSASNQR